MTTTKNKSRPRVAVIGYGWWGRDCHFRLIKLADGLELAGVATNDPTKLDVIRAQQGCRAFPSYEAAFQDPNIDAVVIATPSRLHADLAIQALETGEHVVTEQSHVPDAGRLRPDDRGVGAGRAFIDRVPEPASG